MRVWYHLYSALCNGIVLFYRYTIFVLRLFFDIELLT